MLFLPSASFPHYGFERFFRFAKELGFDGVEITINENFDTQNVAYLKELEERFSMPIKVFSLPPQETAKFIEPFQNVVREFPRTTINLASPEILSFRYKSWIENTVPKLVKKYSLNLNRRNTPFKTILGLIPSRSESSLHTLREAGSVSLDISALWKSHEDAMRAIQFLGEKLRHIYLSNVHRNIPYSPLPTGVLPVESFLTKLKRNSYRGDFTLKISPENLREGDDEQMLEIIRRSKEFFEKYFTNV